MIIEVKNEFVDFKIYPASSVFVEFKKDMGASIEKVLQDPEQDQIKLISKIAYLGHKAYCKVKNESLKVNEEQILDFVTIQELTGILNKFMGVDGEDQKKTK